MTLRVWERNTYEFLIVFILQFWLNILFLLKTESASLVNSLTRTQSDLHKLYYANHRKTKAILAYWICMGYRRHCSTLQARTKPYSTYNFLNGVFKRSSLLLFCETRIMPFQRDISEVGKLSVRGCLAGHTQAPQGSPQGSQLTVQYCEYYPLPCMQVNCHCCGITFHCVLLHFNKSSASPPITHYWKGTILKKKSPPHTKAWPPKRMYLPKKSI